MLRKSESDRIDEVERRLVRKFAQLPVGLIATAVEDAYLRFEDSLIRDYVPLLVERRAHNELARLALDHDPSIEIGPAGRGCGSDDGVGWARLGYRASGGADPDPLTR